MWKEVFVIVEGAQEGNAWEKQEILRDFLDFTCCAYRTPTDICLLGDRFAFNPRAEVRRVSVYTTKSGNCRHGVFESQVGM